MGCNSCATNELGEEIEETFKYLFFYSINVNAEAKRLKNLLQENDLMNIPLDEISPTQFFMKTDDLKM